MGVATEGDLSVIDGATVDEATFVEKYRCDQRTVSIVVVGASGDLAKKKIFPALFALYYQGMLPEVRSSRYRIARGVTRLAASPELPDLWLCTKSNVRCVLSGCHCRDTDVSDRRWVRHTAHSFP